MTNPRSTNHIDDLIGRTILAKRAKHGLSQQALAGKLKITFQQVQKYERGANRVSASRLYSIAKTFDCPITDFFPKPPADAKIKRATKRGEARA